MRRNAFTSLSALALTAGAAGFADAQPLLPTYKAVYEVRYKGRDVGSAEFSVSYDGARDVYTFRSHARIKGMLRLLVPNPTVEHSEFVVRDGQIRPLQFRYEDGTRGARDSFTAVFDWDAKTVLIDKGAHFSAGLAPGTLDRGSMQVAVMRDMATGGTLGPYALADEDSIRTYTYTLIGEERTETALGELATVRYRQQREGSSRSTTLWAAPELRFLPVRIEQQRGNEAQLAFVLESVEGLDVAP
jgi:hypothetical protein